MSEKERAIKELHAGRINMANEFNGVLYETRVFCEAVVNAVGEISREEAIDGIKKFFNEKMDELR